MSTRPSPASPSAISPTPEQSPPRRAARPTSSVAEVARLNKVITALMDRSERNTSAQKSEFGVFQASIMLEERVRLRTRELEAALRENEKVNRALRESEAKFRGLVSQSLVGIVLIEDGKFIYSNAKFDEIFGYRAEEVRELGPLQVAQEGDHALVAENIRKRMSGEASGISYVFHGLRKDGSAIDIECHSSVMRSGSATLLISLVMDITERIRIEREVRSLHEQLRQQSTHDSLTGLYNRRFLEESFGRELLLAERSKNPVSVIMCDLDHFKAVNDRDGHLAGDQVLRVFGELIRSLGRESDIFCRYGGEEFLLVLPGMGEGAAVERAERLRRAMGDTIVSFGATQISVTASFGVATFPCHGRTSDEMIAAADGALYAAKADGRNRVTVCRGHGESASTPRPGGAERCPQQSSALLPPMFDLAKEATALRG